MTGFDDTILTLWTHTHNLTSSQSKLDQFLEIITDIVQRN